jgi:hypothetical protein
MPELLDIAQILSKTSKNIAKAGINRISGKTKKNLSHNIKSNYIKSEPLSSLRTTKDQISSDIFIKQFLSIIYTITSKPLPTETPTNQNYTNRQELQEIMTTLLEKIKNYYSMDKIILVINEYITAVQHNIDIIRDIKKEINPDSISFRFGNVSTKLKLYRQNELKIIDRFLSISSKLINNLEEKKSFLSKNKDDEQQNIIKDMYYSKQFIEKINSKHYKSVNIIYILTGICEQMIKDLNIHLRKFYTDNPSFITQTNNTNLIRLYLNSIKNSPYNSFYNITRSIKKIHTSIKNYGKPATNAMAKHIRKTELHNAPLETQIQSDLQKLSDKYDIQN